VKHIAMMWFRESVIYSDINNFTAVSYCVKLFYKLECIL